MGKFQEFKILEHGIFSPKKFFVISLRLKMSKSEKRKFYNFFEQAYCEKALGEFEKIDLEGRIERILKDYMEGTTPGKNLRTNI